jgi:hypothetical protein
LTEEEIEEMRSPVRVMCPASRGRVDWRNVATFVAMFYVGCLMCLGQYALIMWLWHRFFG